MTESVLVVVNPASGALQSPEERARLRALLDKSGLGAELVETATESDIRRAVARDKSGTIVAAGGDGTVSAVAAAMAGSGRTLGVIPGGTLNHFARDLGIPFDFEQAISLLGSGSTRRVDAAEVNGRRFLNNSSLGLYPEIVRERVKMQRHGMRKWIAFAAATLRTLRHWPLVRLRMRAGKRAASRLTPFVFIGNNRYELAGLHLGSRSRLDAGELSLCVARRMSRFALARLAVRGLVGGLHDSADLGLLCAHEVWIDAGRRVVNVAVDGEVLRMASPLHYRILPGALEVIAP